MLQPERVSANQPLGFIYYFIRRIFLKVTVGNFPKIFIQLEFFAQKSVAKVGSMLQKSSKTITSATKPIPPQNI